MISLIGFIAGTVAPLLLLVAGIGHLLHPRATMGAIRAQQMWPARKVPAVYTGLVMAEILVGGAGVAITTTDARPGIITMLVATALIYLMLAAYATVLLRIRPEAPCGCSISGRKTNNWVLVRTLALAGLAVTAAAIPEPTALFRNGEPLHLATALLASGAIATLIWQLPEVMPEPDAKPRTT